MCPAWKEIYSWSLKSAGDLFATRDFFHLESLLLVMEGQIYNKEARAELLKKTKEVENSVHKQLMSLHADFKAEANPLERTRILAKKDAVTIWKCGELFRFHQALARTYSLIPEGGGWTGGVQG